MIVPDDLEERIRADGFGVVRNVLTAGEVEALARVCDEFFRTRPHMRSNLGRNIPNAVECVPGIQWLYRHPNVLRAFRAALGTDTIVFTRHCDVAKNRLSGWHKDSGANPPYFSGDYFADDACRVYKMALYLQDHTANENGLRVRRGSHRVPDLETGETLHLGTAAGDAIIFDVRLTHAGQAFDFVEKKINLLGTWILGRKADKHDPAPVTLLKDLYWKLLRKPDKLSVFFAYGLANAATREYCEKNMQRQDEQILESGANGAAVDLADLGARLNAAGVPVFGVDF